ncbi:hypothetical protein GJR96_11635 [Haloferax sp. MBLA0076]|uniref:Uncharacterized protein n=1 Tax=Haloferax litoreum TaxID=2666140 RepID=A0A6A8GJE9_9EURY|nr:MULTISPECIES: hypothetical protein [Haloferax]KAB1194052.1 hypothetical protein Hfx1148_11580 [Haloferax sp. CBA1148]MRX22602.1 hypothetical protein [Haloferax litoreum]
MRTDSTTDGSASTRATAESWPVTLWAFVASVVLLSATALFGGAALVAAPDGSRVDAVIDIDPTLLAGSPFSDYTIPGVILFVVLGLLPLVALYGLFARRAWAWALGVVVGGALLVWIAVEVAIVGYIDVLQPLYALLGLFMLAVLASPSVRTRYPGSELWVRMRSG